MPLTVEPTKPRLCHDERFLNLWIKDLPFSLDTLRDVPRLVSKDMYLSSLDDKSGYDHVRLATESYEYFGICFGGWYLVFTVIPFGYKGSAYIYHTTGMAATSYCRKLGVPCLQYIDDRMLGELCSHKQSEKTRGFYQAMRALYIVCQILTRLGYTIGLSKCCFIPSKTLLFLGFFTDSRLMAFILPERKKQKFAVLRDEILTSEVVGVRTLQRFTGKCISFILVVPAAKLYTRECNAAIGKAIRNSKHIPVEGPLRQEILHWAFLDSWQGSLPWRSEKHFQVTMFTDASLYRWGAVVSTGTEVVCGDYWHDKISEPIHIKEAFALLNSLKSVRDKIRDSRVDVFVDNMAVVYAWQGQGAKDTSLSDVIKEIFQECLLSNVDLRTYYVPSQENIADKESRVLSKQDAMLTPLVWSLVQSRFGPHSCDLMSLDSNVMSDGCGRPLRHFTPYPTPFSSGVNIFSQDIGQEENSYVFPPFVLIGPLLRYLQSQSIKEITVIIPKLSPVPFWWPLLLQHAVDQFRLGTVGDRDILLYPSRTGFMPDRLGLPWDLMAFRLKF